MIAVDNLSFYVNKGEIFGTNGAGKTTTTRILCRLISKTSGEANVTGFEIGDVAHSLEFRKIIGLVPDNVGPYEKMSAFEDDFWSEFVSCDLTD